MKFTIEIEEFWLEEDSNSIQDELKSSITDEVTRRIREEIKDKIDSEIKDKVGDFMNARMSVIINDQLASCIENGTIKDKRRSGSEEIKITDYVKDKFLDSSGWGNPDKHIDKIAKEFGVELKLQYNNAFANKIVQNMKEQGLLKDEVVQILLGGDGK